jgi:hypothetical protein
MVQTKILRVCQTINGRVEKMFEGNRKRHYQLMAELRALEAQEAGVTAAQVVTPPKDKLSLGKAVMVLAGLGAVGWWLVFSDDSPFDDKPETTKTKPSQENKSHKILNEIKYGQMGEDKAMQEKTTSKLSTEQKASVFDLLAKRSSFFGGGQ